MNTPNTPDSASPSARACGPRGDHPKHGCGPRRCGPMGAHMSAHMGSAFPPFGLWAWRHTPVNIEETDTAFVLRLLAPDLDKTALQLEVQSDVLSIRYQAPPAEAQRRFTRLERPQRDFVREFALNGRVQVEAIEASYAEGMLTVLLPKTPAAMRPAQAIPVR